jgi:hypothetical protein
VYKRVVFGTCKVTGLFECNIIQASFSSGYSIPYARKRPVQLDGKLPRTLGPPVPDPPPAPPRPTMRHITPFPRAPRLPSLPSFTLPKPKYIQIKRSRWVSILPRPVHSFMHRSGQSPRRRRRKYWIEYSPNPDYRPLEYDFALDFQ